MNLDNALNVETDPYEKIVNDTNDGLLVIAMRVIADRNIKDTDRLPTVIGEFSAFLHKIGCSILMT